MNQDKKKHQSIPEQAPNVEQKPSVSQTWNSDSLEELEDWIEEQGIQLRY